MHVSKLGVVGTSLALATIGCTSDDTSGPPPAPIGDSGSTSDGGSTDPEDGASDAPVGDGRPCEGSTIASGTFKLVHDGIEYPYIVHVPPSYDGSKRTPLVLHWHGRNSNALQQQLYTSMDATSDEKGFILVYPDSPSRTWNAGNCCGAADAGVPTADHVGFARALVSELSAAACIDSKRVYSLGLSAGGYFGYRLACEAADVFAAFAGVSAQMGVDNCQPSRPVPVLHFHGTGDQLVGYNAPEPSAEGLDVPGMMRRWSERNGCTKGPETTFQMGVATCQTWSQCTGDVLVTLCSIEGTGHCWPGQTFCPNNMPTTQDISANTASWDFFQRFVLP